MLPISHPAPTFAHDANMEKPAKVESKEPVKQKPVSKKVLDAKNVETGKPEPIEDPEFEKYGIYQSTAPRAGEAEPVITNLPLTLNRGDRIAMIGNTLLERSQRFGNFEAMVQTAFPEHELVVRHLAWSADEVDAQPRPDNFADTAQHLAHEKTDVIFAAFGFNESFDGKEGAAAFRQQLTDYVSQLKNKAFNGSSAPRIVLVSPIANENVQKVAAADRNNAAIKQYAAIIQEVAIEQQVEDRRDQMDDRCCDGEGQRHHEHDRRDDATTNPTWRKMRHDPPDRCADTVPGTREPTRKRPSVERSADTGRNARVARPQLG